VQTWILSENMTDERQNRQIDNDAFWAPFISADYLKRYNGVVMQDLLQKLTSKELLGRLRIILNMKSELSATSFFLN
jgi:hypothetical protein